MLVMGWKDLEEQLADALETRDLLLARLAKVEEELASTKEALAAAEADLVEEYGKKEKYLVKLGSIYLVDYCSVEGWSRWTTIAADAVEFAAEDAQDAVTKFGAVIV